MPSPDFKDLLQQAASRPLTPTEEEELRRQLESPENQAIADEELAALRHQVSEILRYREALRQPTELPPAGRRAEFGRVIQALQRGAAAKPRRTRPRRLFSFVLMPALVACLALLFFMIGDRTAGRENIQLGLISAETQVRGAHDQLAADLGAHWQIVELQNLAALALWSQSPLPPSARARVWIDEEQGELVALTRNRAGTLQTIRQPLDPHVPSEVQLRKLAESLDPK